MTNQEHRTALDQLAAVAREYDAMGDHQMASKTMARWQLERAKLYGVDDGDSLPSSNGQHQEAPTWTTAQPTT